MSKRGYSDLFRQNQNRHVTEPPPGAFSEAYVDVYEEHGYSASRLNATPDRVEDTKRQIEHDVFVNPKTREFFQPERFAPDEERERREQEERDAAAARRGGVALPQLAQLDSRVAQSLRIDKAFRQVLRMMDTKRVEESRTDFLDYMKSIGLNLLRQRGECRFVFKAGDLFEDEDASLTGKDEVQNNTDASASDSYSAGDRYTSNPAGAVEDASRSESHDVYRIIIENGEKVARNEATEEEQEDYEAVTEEHVLYVITTDPHEWKVVEWHLEVA